MKPTSESTVAQNKRSPLASGETPDNRPRNKGSGSETDTAQSAHDKKEKAEHPSSENELESSQDKNPVPPDSVRK